MKTAVTVLLMTSLLSLALAGSAWAGRIEDRQAAQMQSIHNGLTSGRLTRFETRDLIREQQTIRREIRRARADGRLTRAERRHLHFLQYQAAHHIRRLKNNQLVSRPSRFEKGVAPMGATRGRI